MNGKKEDLIFKVIDETNMTPMKKLLKKYDYVEVYKDGIILKICSVEQKIPIEKILDIFVHYNIAENKGFSTTYIYYNDFDEKKEEKVFRSRIPSNAFIDVDKKFEELVENGYGNVSKPNSKTIQWIIACLTVQSVQNIKSPYSFGSTYKTPYIENTYKKNLSEGWGVNNRNELIEAIESLISCQSVWVVKNHYDNNYISLTDNQLDIKDDIMPHAEKGMWAWELQRAILVSSFGYASSYLTLEEALDYALIAAKKLQLYYYSWDDFMDSYIYSFSFFGNFNPSIKGSKADERYRIYKEMKNNDINPWKISWRQNLTKEW